MGGGENDDRNYLRGKTTTIEDHTNQVSWMPHDDVIEY